MSDLVKEDISGPSTAHCFSSSAIHDSTLEKRVWRKLDLYVLPVVAMFYFLSFLDRTNIGNVRVAGLQRDLEMTDKQYSMALTVTYIPYIAAELPSNLLLRTVGPNFMLPTMLTLWGVVATLQGLVRSYSGLLTARFFLGLLEGGIYPGLILYLSLFYPRHKMTTRISAFFSSASLSGAFSGVLAFVIIKIKESPTQTRPGWAWVFIIEGLFTVLFGLVSFILLPRSPKTTRLFTPKERDWGEVRRAFVLPHVIMLAIIFFFSGVAFFGLAFFVPSIIVGLGYTASAAQLMSVPPFVAAFVVALSFAFVSDRYKCRGLVIITTSVIGATGFALFLGSESYVVQYASLFLSISGVYAMAPVLGTWLSNNTAPHTRRATALAFGLSCSNMGGIFATWLLGSLSPAPRYHSATIVLLVLTLGMGVLGAVNLAYLKRENRRKAEVRRHGGEGGKEGEGSGLGDQSAWFVYML
ncbi:MFS transporter superfamily protein [Pleurotus pulmonarius]